MMTYKPFTEDYVPLLPWFDEVLIGIFLGYSAIEVKRFASMLKWQPKVATPLAYAGRHSLLIYMLHQPLLLGVLYLLR